MTTETEIVNAALRKVGAKRIMDISDAVGSAGIAADVLAFERDELLRSATWNFAINRVSLAPLVAVPAFGYASAFALPADCVRVISVHEDTSARNNPEYKIESVQQADETYVRAILSDSDVLYLRYVRLVADPNEMAKSFQKVLILRLAKIFAGAIAKSNTMVQLIDEELKTVQARARSTDGVEDFPERLNEGSWANSRGGYGRSQGFWSR